MRSHARHAFSLIEIVIVVAIIAVVAAVAVPRYASALSNYRAKGAAQALASMVLEAQASARASSANVTLAFSGGTFTTTDANGNKLRELRIDSETYRAAVSSYTLGGDRAIIFDGFGAPDSVGSIQLASGPSAYKVTITTDGRVQVSMAVANVTSEGSGSSSSGGSGSSGSSESSGSSGGVNVNLGPLDISLGGGGASIQLN